MHQLEIKVLDIVDARCNHEVSPDLSVVILAKYRLWLPDDGFLVNRNLLEQFSLF